jgi:hypothetical protein
MSVEILEQAGQKFIEVDLSGKLTREDYEKFGPQMDRLIAEHGKIRLLTRMENFDGWTAGGLWEDIKFDFKHFNDIDRVAFVGDEKWEKGMSKFCKPFTRAEIRFFRPERIQDARNWLEV